MKILLQYAFITVLSSLVVNSSLFADDSSNNEDTGLSGSVTIGYLYNDNILSDQNNIIGANILTVSPTLRLSGNSGTNSFEFALNGNIGKYEGSSEDNYSDSGLSASGNFDFNARNRLNLSASINSGSDNRGSNFSQGNGAQQPGVDEFSQNSLVANYSFGRASSVGQLDFSLSTQNVDYDSRFDLNEVDLTLARDRSNLDASVRFTYSMTAKTNLIATVRSSDMKYDINTGLDATEKALLVGLSWAGSAKTTGSIQLGYNDRTVDNGDEDSGSTWQVGITWSPLSYSNFNLTTSKNSEESIGIGSFRTVTSSGLNWGHTWNGRLTSSVSVQLRDTDFEGTDFSDSNRSFLMALNYKFQDSMSLSLSYTNTEVETNNINLPYNSDREIIGLSLIYSLK